MKKLIHGLWHEGHLPDKCFADSWREKNPGADVRVWTFAEAERLMRDGSFAWVAETFQRMPFLLQRANVLRVVIVAVLGGIYLDLDMECLRPLDVWFEKELVLGNAMRSPRTVVCNAILGAAGPRHPLWTHLLHAICLKPANILRDTDAINTSGSLLLTGAVDELGLMPHVQSQSVFFPGQNAAGREAFTRHHTGRPAWVGKQYIGGELHENQSTLANI